MGHRALLLWVVPFLALPAHSLPGADLLPPSWRGASGTTMQAWDFASDANPAAPDAGVNEHGTGSAAIVIGAFGSGWIDELPGLGSARGLWDLGAAGTIIVTVPAASGTPSRQTIWVQAVYFADLSAPPAVTVPGASALDTRTSTVETVPGGGRWILEQSAWELEPGVETVGVLVTADGDFGSVVDALVIDTLSESASPPAPDMLLLD